MACCDEYSNFSTEKSDINSKEEIERELIQPSSSSNESSDINWIETKKIQ